MYWQFLEQSLFLFHGCVVTLESKAVPNHTVNLLHVITSNALTRRKLTWARMKKATRISDQVSG